MSDQHLRRAPGPGAGAEGGGVGEEESLNAVHSARAAIRLPSVIRLLEYRRIPHQTRALSRKNILMRDRYTCQYCHRTLPSGELTLDHVVPRSRAGESAWENLVACCHVCNNRKGSRTPEEAGMRLLRQPRPFSLHTSRHLIRMLGKSDAQWRKVPVLLRIRRGGSRRYQRVRQMALGVISGMHALHNLRHRAVQHAK